MAVKPFIIIIVQARMGSTRLPGKTLKEVMGKPLLAYLLERLRSVKIADKIVVATTLNPIDDPIVRFCESLQADCFRGSEDDVLERYLLAARKYKADVIVRVTSDCPLIDPDVVDQVIGFYLDSYPSLDYASNTLVRTYPRGMDVEVFSTLSFEKIAKEASRIEEREHVTLYYYTHPESFRLGGVTKEPDDSHLRLTVDTEEDFRLISTVLESLYPGNNRFNLKDILDEFKAHPEWPQINSRISQKPIFEGKP